MRRDADRVALCDFCNRNAAIDRRLKVDMVGADAGGQRELELRGIGDPLGGQIGRPKRLRDYYLGIGKFALKYRIRTVLARRDDKRMTVRLEIFSQAQFARNAAKQGRSEEHTSELQSLMRISYAVF